MNTKKWNSVKKIFSVLLVWAMIFTNTGVTILAEAVEAGAGAEVSPVSSEAEAAKAEAERKAAEEAAKEESERIAAEEAAKAESERIAAEEAAKAESERIAAEEAAKAESEKAETPTETESATEKATETVTEPVTEGATEEIQETESEAVSEAESESESASESESESETESESESETEELPTEFTYEDDEMVVKAVVSDAEKLPRGAKLNVKEISDTNKEEYKQAVEVLQGRFVTDSENPSVEEELEGYRVYDIYFHAEDDRLSAADVEAEITVTYKKELELAVPGKKEFADTEPSVKSFTTELAIYNVKKAEKAEAEITSQDGNIRSFRYKASGIEPIVLAAKTVNQLVGPVKFVWEDGEKTVTAVLDDPKALPVGAEFVVEDLTQEEYEANKNIIIEQLYASDKSLGETEEERLAYAEQIMKNLVLYDMHFVYQGEEIEAEGTEISVNIENKVPMQTEVEDITETDDYLFVKDEEAEEEVMAVHIKETASGKVVEEVTEQAQTDASGAVEAVDLTTDSFSVIGYVTITPWSSIDITDDTIWDFGGNYSLYYILNNFNVFTSGDATCGHTIGAVAVGGKASFGMGIGRHDYKHTTPSYFGGSVERFNSYLGNNVIFLKDYTESIPNWAYESYDVRISERYINFNEAFVSIRAETNAYANSPDNIQVDLNTPSEYYSVNGSTVTVKAGYGYEFTSFDGIDYINIEYGAGDNYGNVNIVCKAGGTVYTPQIQFNGSAELPGMSGDKEVGTGCGVVFLLPNASVVDDTKAYSCHIGHVAAPNAVIQNVNGDANGCWIAKSVNIPGTESHMWPYNGSIIRPVSHGFEASKTVDGKTPTSDQIFTFNLDELRDRGWVNLQTKQNAGGTVSFDEINYAGDNSVGTHWYRIYEVAGNDSGYVYSRNIYLVKVTVTKKVGNGTTSFEKEVSYYKAKGNATLETFPETAEEIENENIVDVLELKKGESSGSILTFANTRNTYGDLTVKKTVAGNAGDKTKDFQFTVTLSNKNINGQYGEMSFANGVATFTLKDGESKTAEKLPTGISYEVSERDYLSEGYLTASSGDVRGTISEDCKLVAEFTNTRDAEGSLIITKLLAGNDTDHEKEFTFNIELADESINGIYSGVTFTKGKATIILRGGDNKVIEGLPNGVDYTVTEADYTGDGYTTAYEGNTGTIRENVPASATITNTRNTYGELTVKKTVAGNAGDTEKEFQFTVTVVPALDGTYGDMEFEDGVATFTLKDGQSKKATGLPTGTQYLVTEENYESDGYVTNATGSQGMIRAGEDNTAAFTNTRNVEGSLTVSKILAGNDTDAEKEFTFTITLGNKDINGTYSGVEFKNGEATFTLKGGESKDIMGLPNGVEYTVTEADYSSDGYETTMTGNTGTINEHASSVAVFTNTRNTFGDLTVKKVVAGNAADTEKEFNFIVTLSDKRMNKTFGDMTFVDGVAKFTLKDGESKTATGLPNGIPYTVEEESYAAEGYVTTRTGETGRIAGNSKQVAVFTNTRNATGSLAVSKTLAGNDTNAAKDFTFTITLDETIHGTYSGVEFKDGKATIKLRGGESKEIMDLPNGVRYTVTEADYSSEGYVTTMTGDTGTILEGKVAAAEFTNTRDTYGDLTVKKTVAGNAADRSKEFNFKVTLSDFTVSGSYGDMTFTNGVAEFTLKDGESKKATGLPTGTGYLVEEDSYVAEGYITEKSGETGKITEKCDLTAAFTNTRNAEGSLTVIKLLEGNDTDAEKEFTFTITLDDTDINGTYSGVKFTDGEATITLKGGESKVIMHLPNGVGYTVTEEDYSAEGYITTKEGETGTISEHTAAAAVFTNTRNSFRGLTVKKEWDDADNQDGLRPGSVAVQLIADGEPVGELVILDESNGWTYTWNDLAKRANGKDIVYEVEEAKVEGYEPEYSVNEDTITVTNTYIPETVEVSGSKTWADQDNQDGVRPESITIRLYADGVETAHREVKAADNWSWSFKDLPKFAKGKEIVYTITEDPVENYESTVDGYNVTNTYVPQNGSISVTKYVTFNGRGIKLDKSFYVALFMDAAGTNRYSDVMELRISGDEQSDGTATVTFTGLPYGTYYVFETEADGSPFLGDDMGIKINATVTNGTIALSPANLNGAATITNDYTDTPPDGFTYTEEPETESESEYETEEESEEESETKKAVGKVAKTGDETNYMIYILLAVFAAVICGAGVYFKRRKRVD